MSAAPAATLGLDVGGTKIAGLLVGTDDAVLARLVVPTDGRDLAEQVLEAAQRTLANAPAHRLEVVGIGVPGQVDQGNGMVRLAVNLDAHDLPLGSIVSGALGVPAFLEHDARAAALWLHAQLPDPRAGLAYLSVGTGISAAIVIEGRLLRGVRGLAGEIGHVVADPDGAPCVCGMRGCLEAMASGPAVARMAAESGLAAPDPATVFRLASAGDPRAVAIADQVGAYLARSVRALVLTFGVDRVDIGGGMARAGQAFIGPVMAELDREQAASPLVREAFADACVELLADPDAGVRGAIAVARAGLQGEVGDG